MGQLALYKDEQSNVTVLSNQFIDHYMKDANDAQIKIYLYLLRLYGSEMDISVSSMADIFNYTEKDILRALKYWEKNQLLSLSFDEQKQLCGIRILPFPVKKASQQPIVKAAPSAMAAEAMQTPYVSTKVCKIKPKPSYSVNELASFKARPEISQLLFIAEQYLKKTLSSVEISSFLYMNQTLQFDADLIEYLVEYCVENKKKSIRFMDAVAESWAKEGIKTAAEAKAHVHATVQEAVSILRAYGITNRNPVEPEVVYAKKWLQEYGFSMDIIVEAINRTLMTAHAPSFEYTDTILESWKKAGVKHISDIEALDLAHKQSRQPKQEAPKKTAGTNKFNSFPQRKYDFDQFNKELMSN